MSLDKKTLANIFAAGEFDVSDQLRRTFENMDPAEILGALDEIDLPKRTKQRLIEKYSPKTSLSFDIRILSKVKRWNPYIGSGEIDVSAKPFKYDHQTLIRRAIANRQKVVGNNVTDFSGWVLSLYWNKPNKASQDGGKKAERQIVDYIKANCPPSEYGDWKKIYQDAGVKVKSPPYNISALLVNASPLVARPDFVFQHKNSGEIIVVEIKASLADIPSDGWPNVRAQLWAYGKIDAWKDAPRVTLIGEVWCVTDGCVFRRQVNRWVSNDERFERENSELFEIYGGTALVKTP